MLQTHIERDYNLSPTSMALLFAGLMDSHLLSGPIIPSAANAARREPLLALVNAVHSVSRGSEEWREDGRREGRTGGGE